MTRHLLAMPGDPDLDADVDGLTVTAVVHNTDTRELLVKLVDGHGHFIDTTGRRREFTPGEPDRRVKHAEEERHADRRPVTDRHAARRRTGAGLQPACSLVAVGECEGRRAVHVREDHEEQRMTATPAAERD
ncbi:hypothetical protein [Micromonospora profundi]|uniref:hypothetical protein n=1 Tax=Micromonospora profundi TaxID=1420889 RepID=UPI003648A5C6